MGAKNSKVPTRDDDEHFMIIAEVSAERSEDPSRRVGCCIVDDEQRIISTGFNSMPRGCGEFPWSKEGLWIDTKYPYVCHAEADAILNGQRSMKNGTMYTTLFPCNECAKLIVQSGIRHVKYMDSKGDVSASAARRMFAASNVCCSLIAPARKAILVSRETNDTEI
jgi:dCMP deaminase